MGFATLAVDFVAKFASFEESMAKASKSVDGLDKKFSAIGGAVNKALGAFGVALSAGALVSYSKGVLDAADNLNDMSVRLGVSVKDLASFKLAAEQSGTSLDGVGAGIAKLTKSIGEAEAGNKGMAQALTELGITARDPREAFYQLADAVQRIEDPSKRAALLSQALGKSYGELLPLLSQGSAELRKSAEASESFAEQMARLAPNADKFNDQLASLKQNASNAAASILAGMVPALDKVLERMNTFAQYKNANFGDLFGALSGRASRDLSNVNKEITSLEATIARLRKNSGGMDSSIAPLTAELGRLKALRAEVIDTTVAPLLEPPKSASSPSMAGDSTDAMACTLSGGTWDGKRCIPKKTTGTDPQGAFVSKLRDEAATLGLAGEALQRYEALKLKLTGANARLADGYIKQIAAFNDQQAAAKANNDEFDEAFKKQEDLRIAQDNSIKSLREWIAEQEFEASLFGKSNAEREAAIQLRAVEAAGIDVQTEAFRKMREQLVAISETKQLDALIGNADFGKLKRDQDDMVLLAKAFTEGILQADGSLRKLSESEYIAATTARLGLAKKEVDELDTFAKKAAENMQDSFADFLFDPFDQGMDGMVKGFAKTLQRMAADAAAADIARFLFGDSVKGGTGSGLAGDLLSGIGELFGFADGGIAAYGRPVALPRFAGGGVSNSAAIFGEAGPEAAVPLPDGRRIPVDLRGSGGGQVVLQQYFTIDARGADAGVEARIRQAAADGARQGYAMVVDDLSRGGAVARLVGRA